MSRRRSSFRSAVASLYTNVVHQVMQRCLDDCQLSISVPLSNLPIMLPAPALDRALDVVEQPVEFIETTSHLSSVALMLLGMNVLRGVEDLVGPAVTLGEVDVVSVVVMQVQTEIVRDLL